MTTTRHSAQSLVDTDRYPLHQPDTPGWNDLVETCRRHLDECGGIELEGFIRPAALDAMVAEAERLAASAHRTVGRANARLRAPSRGTPADHPDRVLGRSSLGIVANDLVPRDGALRTLYEWDALRRFLAAAYRKPRVYPYADDLRPLNLFVMRDGDQNWWHLDQVEFTTLLQLRNAQGGGLFEYVPLPPETDPERLRVLRRVVAGEAPELVRTMERPPGSIQLFRGTNVVHRVTPVVGPVSRLTAILGFDARPDKVSSDNFRIGRYGRVEATSCGLT